jgi:phosphohistidine swiveling domain-containing protein
VKDMNKNYRLIFGQKLSLISSEAHMRQYLDHRDIFGSTHNYAFHFSQKGVAEEFHRDIDNQRWIQEGKRLLNKDFFMQLLEQAEKLRLEQKVFIERLESLNLRNLSDAELKTIFFKAYQLFSRLRGYFKTSRHEFQLEAEFRLKALLFKKTEDKQAAQNLFEILVTPHEFDEINQEFLDWVGIVSKNKNIEKLVTRHIYKYPWLVGQSYNKPEIIKTFKEKYKKDHRNLSGLLQRAKKLRKNKRMLKIKQSTILKKFQHKEINYLSWLFQQAAVERMRLKGGWWGADFLYLKLYKEISRRTAVPLKDLYSGYRIDEVIKAVSKRKPIVDRKELQRRRLAYVIFLKNRHLLFYSGAKAQRIINTELKAVLKKEYFKELRGTVASVGRAQGRVRIVVAGDLSMLQEAEKNLRKGDIMITTMTQPSMTALMKKAGAIVTDEGGMISHAAIMAREFGIPCIVGTELATKVFKDGDLVEVDANMGVVKKLVR